MLIWMLVAFFLILGPLMFLHELGHFWAAKRGGVPVYEFGFGLGPKLKTLFVRDGTEYTIRAIPFAAFVRLAGENETGVDYGIMNASRRVRLAVYAAGPAMNIVATIVLLWMAYLFGPPAYTRVALEAVDANSPAEQAGLLPGDLILKAGDVDIEDSGALSDYTQDHLGEEINLLVQRSDEQLEIPLTPRMEGQYDPAVEGPLGVTLRFMDGPPAPQNVLLAGQSALNDFGEVLSSTVKWPAKLVRALWSRTTQDSTSGIPAASDEDLRLLRPVGIYGILQLIALTLQAGITQGYLFYILQTAGLISMALGMTNLLPLPALDGGHLFFIALDWVTQKLFNRRISTEKQMLVHAIGMMALLALMVFITWQDIVNPIFQIPPTPTP